MRLSFSVDEHHVTLTGLPKGISPEALADYANLLQDKVLALYNGEKGVSCGPSDADPSRWHLTSWNSRTRWVTLAL